MAYDLKKIFYEKINRANEAINRANDLTNELTKQMLTLTTFFLMFLSSFSYYFKNKYSDDIKTIILFAIAFSAISILLGLLSLFAASEFFARKGKELHSDAEKIQECITSTNSEISEKLPCLIRGAESSLMEGILSWGHKMFFVISIVLDLVAVVCFVIR